MRQPDCRRNLRRPGDVYTEGRNCEIEPIVDHAECARWRIGLIR